MFVKPWPRVISFKRDCTVVCVGTNQKPGPRYNPVGNARDKKKQHEGAALGPNRGSIMTTMVTSTLATLLIIAKPRVSAR